MLEDVNPLTYAVERFPVELPQGMAHNLIHKVMTHLPGHAREENKEQLEEARCNGFCKHIKFKSNSPAVVKNLLITIPQPHLYERVHWLINSLV